MNAKQMAQKLDISSATLYRLTDPLLEMGLIRKHTTYPYKFSAKPTDEGLSLFLLNQNEWFMNQFGSHHNNKNAKKESTSDSKEVRISFIQSRGKLMSLSADEISKAAKSIDLLRSGHELTADVMASLTDAKIRGVPTRMLIQDYSNDNAGQVSNWQKNGIFVKKTPLRHVRLMIYDASTVYFMSYKNADSEKDLGMKIKYPPLAVIFSQLFNEWWQKAEKV